MACKKSQACDLSIEEVMFLAQLTDLQKVRRERARKRLFRNVLLLALFAAAVYVLVLVSGYLGNLDMKAALGDMKAEIGSGDGYPVRLPGGRVQRFSATGDMLTLMTDTHIYTYNAGGSQMLSEQHGVARPVLETAKDRNLIYDRGGKKVSLYSKSGFLRTMDLQNNIHNADVSDNGNVALVTDSQDSFAQVVVYNGKFKEIFKWQSSLPVISISLAPNRDAMMVGRVDVNEMGEYCSSISRFQFSMDKVLGEIKLDGELLLDIDYNGSTVRAITDKRIILMGQDLKVTASYDYSGKRLQRFYCPNNGQLSVLLLGNYAEDRQLQMVILDGQLKEQGQGALSYDVMDAKTEKDYVYVASGNHIDIFDAQGNLLSTQNFSPLYYVAPISSKLYYVTNSDIAVVNVKEALNPDAAAASDGVLLELFPSNSASDSSDMEEAIPGGEQSGLGQSSEAAESTADELLDEILQDMQSGESSA